jgi:hypothetical protein
MDAKAKKALVDTLSDAKNFDTLYPTDSRRWFVDMAIRAFEAQSMSDVQIETKTIDLIVKATSRRCARARRCCARASTPPRRPRTSSMRRRCPAPACW